MSSDDIANLYRQFGGQPDNYQELGRDNVVRQSRERWPLLADVRRQDAARAALLPVSEATEKARRPAEGPLPTVFDEAATARAASTRQAPPAMSPRPEPVEPVPSSDSPAPALPPFAWPVSGSTTFTPVPATTPVAVPAPVASYAPHSSSAPSSAAASGSLQGVFARLARPADTPPPPADPEVSFLRRLLRP